MGFLGVYTAVYDYQPQAENELEITEGDLLYVLEKSSEDDWWKAKKKAAAEDDDEPVGLVPNNYVEEVDTSHSLLTLQPFLLGYVDGASGSLSPLSGLSRASLSDRRVRGA